MNKQDTHTLCQIWMKLNKQFENDREIKQEKKNHTFVLHSIRKTGTRKKKNQFRLFYIVCSVETFKNGSVKENRNNVLFCFR